MKDIIQVIKQKTESLKAEMWHSKKSAVRKTCLHVVCVFVELVDASTCI